MACCHCHQWAADVAECGPFQSGGDLIRVAKERWSVATESEILEAFLGHPQIGDMNALRNRFAKTASAEQGQVTTADETTLRSLKAGNDDYVQRFGFIFIVFASGKSAAEMLALLQARLGNSREQELVNGAEEQGKILRLRLSQLIEELV